MKHYSPVRAILLICFCMIGITLAAQQPSPDSMVEIDVTVVDSENQPLPGATVQISGKKQGVISDMDGRVKLWVDRGARVEFRYVGLKTVSVKVNKPLKGDILLEDDSSQLDQVVVTGYQRTTKRRTTGSVATLSAEDLKGSPTANLDMLMQGKVAGMDVKALSGRPGESAKVRIRGTNTITGNADPLWVVDGVPLQKDIPAISSSQVKAGDFNDIFTNGISGINPNDIESITVLKDASAGAIYGSRAAGGVIVITTKRGKEGKLNVNYSANVSIVTKPPHDANLMNSTEKLAWEQELWDEFSADRMANGLRYPVIGAVGQIRSGYGQYAGWTKEQQDAEISRLGEQSTDWYEELFQNSVSNSHYLSLSGGSDKTSYYVSLGYAKNNGLVKKTDYERYNINSKLDLKPSRRLKIGIQLDLSMQESNGASLNVDPFKYAYFANPYERTFNADGSYAADNTYHTFRRVNGATAMSEPENGFNIIRELNETSSQSKNLSAQAIATLSYNILDNLSFEGLASYSYTDNHTDNINGSGTYAAWLDRPFDPSFTSKRTYGSITQTSAYNTSYNLRGHFHYSNTFADDHYVSALAGAEIRGAYAKSIFEKRYGYDPVTGNSAFPVYPEGSDVDYSTLLAYAKIIDGLSGQSREKTTFASFYLSLDYVLKNRYILSVTGRTDGSNNFGSDEQFNPTGSVGLSWNVDQESFFQSLKPVFSTLSVRTALGYTGNINKSVYPQLVMDYSNYFRNTGDTFLRIGDIRNAPNPRLRWEKTRDMKVSVDMGFLNDRIRLQGELYDRRTRDAVSSVPVVYTTGFSSQTFNTSELLNQGAELTVSATAFSNRDWRVTLSANLAWNRNKLLKYTPTVVSMFNENYEGYPLGSIISGRVKGIDPKHGIYIYEVRPDVEMTTDTDRRKSNNYAFYLGTSSAPTNGGYSVSVGYKRLTLSMGGSFSWGGKILNNVNCPISYASLDRGSAIESVPTQENDLYTNYLNVTKDRVNRWTPDNPIVNAYPRIIDAYGDRLGLDDYMVTSDNITRASMMEDVSYFKLGSILLSYSMDYTWLKRAFINSIVLSAGVSNVFTITDYDGIDPETPGAVYPQPRTYSMGLSVNF